MVRLTYPPNHTIIAVGSTQINRHECQETFWGLCKVVRPLSLKTQHIWVDFLKYMGASTPQNPKGLHGLLQGRWVSIAPGAVNSQPSDLRFCSNICLEGESSLRVAGLMALFRTREVPCYNPDRGLEPVFYIAVSTRTAASLAWDVNV
jgi:hypothetical protein